MPTEPPTKPSKKRPERGSSPGSRSHASDTENFCSFCGKPPEEVDALVEGYGGRDPKALAATEPVQASSSLRGISICNECIDLCKAILEEAPDSDPESGFYETHRDDESHAAERTAPSANRAAGQNAVELVRQSNQLRDIVAELHETLDRAQQEHAEARRQRLEDKVDRLAELASDARQRLDTAEEEWKRARSLAIRALIGESGLEESAPWPGPPARQARALTPSLACSFCGKPRGTVKTLITGPSVCICNECVEIIDEAMTPA
jgi:hypothetical protein